MSQVRVHTQRSMSQFLLKFSNSNMNILLEELKVFAMSKPIVNFIFKNLNEILKKFNHKKGFSTIDKVAVLIF
ncbi:hypothetical protein CV657_05415 [Borreliella burgdorferi]|uniref:hypothetical protein n=1 Tax=Borreliella burgdorferi TaxID=139 RepID=UPI0009B65B66|nr:hypothetical protein [Borreliella burgdorferi]PRQ89773.1 hypothetical protein CV697_04700 [Borreliella burgdorferi]PRQ97475.1 hypothetical protein CV679_05420 [Borreliella burgdorferi]PRR01294.1 hypothetical protein CV665_05380 [Borreliella burgdorferi]PRR02425.1 hypothetical protein CV669_05580 [Borreliella burgdorferi]PRR05714.1 hypothetical protein CV664_05260 [Borreliella burgdorferi]